MLSRRRFDVDEYYRMARAGILRPDDRVELIDGEIVEMSPIGVRHASCVRRLTRALALAAGDPGRVSIRCPIRIDRYSEPQPDVVLLRPRDDDYATAHPGPEDVLLLVEVADSSLVFDRGVKLELYARAGIPEVWIVDLTADALEVHRQPEGGVYRVTERLAGGSVRPAAFPDLEIRVGDLVPVSD